MLCSREDCDLPLTDVEELWVVQVADETITSHPEKVRVVDPHPYD